MLMERLRGEDLDSIWWYMDTAQKKVVMEQLAGVLAELSTLKIDQCGAIDANGKMTSLHRASISLERRGREPRKSMTDFLLSFIPAETDAPEEARVRHPVIRRGVTKFLDLQEDDPLYNPPYRLIHGDFDSQNPLLSWPDRLNHQLFAASLIGTSAMPGPCTFSTSTLTSFATLIDIWPERFAENKKLR